MSDKLSFSRIVVKLGTSTLTAGTPRLSAPRLVDLVSQTASLVEAGGQVVVVSSGAIAAGRERLNYPQLPKDIPAKQMLAAVGQPRLMALYEQLFGLNRLTVAQVLLTRADLSDRRRYVNSRNTLAALLANGVVPVINENDTVATEEIRFGDNDNLSAQVGPTSTTPIEDTGWNCVAVSVDGSASVNNQIHSVTVRTLSPSGVRRTYTLGARKAAARFNFTGNPAANDTVTLDPGTDEVFTFKSALGGTPATSDIMSTGTNPSDGDTITIGGITYTFKSAVTASYATAIIELNDAVAFERSGAETSKGEVAIRVGGYQFYVLFGTDDVHSYEAGYIDGYKNATDFAPRLKDCLMGVYDADRSGSRPPLSPTGRAPGSTPRRTTRTGLSGRSGPSCPRPTWGVILKSFYLPN